jgi:hypothetical protein
MAAIEFTAAEFAGRPNPRAQELPDEIAQEIGGDTEAKVAALQAVTETLRP